jgi:hypothetical protein
MHLRGESLELGGCVHCLLKFRVVLEGCQKCLWLLRRFLVILIFGSPHANRELIHKHSFISHLPHRSTSSRREPRAGNLFSFQRQKLPPVSKSQEFLLFCWDLWKEISSFLADPFAPVGCVISMVHSCFWRFHLALSRKDRPIILPNDVLQFIWSEQFSDCSLASSFFLIVAPSQQVIPEI